VRVLHTTEFYDPHAGGNLAIQRVSEELVRRGHTVTVATTSLRERTVAEIAGVRIEPFRVRGSLVKGIGGEHERYQQFLLDGEFDVVTNFFADIWTTDLAFEVLDRIRGAKVLATPCLSKLERPTHRDYFYRVYLDALAGYDRIIYLSAANKDKRFGDEHGFGEKASIIPNGAGKEFLSAPAGFKQAFGIQTPLMFLTVANHYLAKGHAFVIEAFHRMRRSDATLVIIGEKPFFHSWYSCWPRCALSALLDRRIKVLRVVPRHWVVAAFQEADLFLFGSRVECAPLVMYEAFASRTPFVTTPVGNVVDHADVVQIVGTPEEMSRTANALLGDAGQRQRLVERGSEVWRARPTWAQIGGQYEALYATLVDGRRPAGYLR
jgi:glycosyltransferase involved in cell wall biosynthesis